MQQKGQTRSLVPGSATLPDGETQAEAITPGHFLPMASLLLQQFTMHPVSSTCTSTGLKAP